MNTKVDVQPQKIIEKLKLAIKEADFDAAPVITQEALDAGVDPAQILQEGVCQALMEIEHDFFGDTKPTMHPTHLMGVEGARRSIAVLEPLMDNNDGKSGTIVIGVPSGDTHDFGTKTVALSLIAAGFKVEYLGRDVAPLRFVQKAQESNADLIGISCYQTTGFKKVEEIIDLLSQAKLQDKIKVMVGGSVITQKYADKLNIEYAKNAAGAVELAKSMVRR
ncbi:MAG: cobalamin-dependent protein [Bacteroidales bacterium]|nr:cobalamin-dependent protein [Bacteroidales bacterium]